MGLDHLNSLILLSVKHSMSKSLNFDDIYDIFAKNTIAKNVISTLNSNVTRLKFSIESTIFRFVI